VWWKVAFGSLWNWSTYYSLNVNQLYRILAKKGHFFWGGELFIKIRGLVVVVVVFFLALDCKIICDWLEKGQHLSGSLAPLQVLQIGGV